MPQSILRRPTAPYGAYGACGADFFFSFSRPHPEKKADKRALIATWTGAVDVRRVAPECKEDEFPLDTSAYAPAIGVPWAVRKSRGLASKSGFEGKGYSRKLRRHQSKLRSLPWQSRLSSRSLGYRCGMPVCERTRSARCTASECKDASGCKDDTRLRGLLLGRVRCAS